MSWCEGERMEDANEKTKANINRNHVGMLVVMKQHEERTFCELV